MSISSFRQRLRQMRKKTAYPVGHFYSPIPDREEARIAVDLAYARRNGIPAGIAIDDDAMQSLWAKLVPFMADAPFAELPGPGRRYFYDNPLYSYGDALVLHAILRLEQPDILVEIGSGYSSAAVLDTREAFGYPRKIVCIEPYPDRLKSLLKPDDCAKTRVLEQKVQDTDMAVFSGLGAGDILFVDSSHVMKTGSDLSFIFHEILPGLAAGVIIHFHDIFWPFEYPRKWAVDENRAWNEIYAVRNFLMYNAVFEILFFNSYFAHMHGKTARDDCPLFAKQPGGGLWLKKRSR